jgi:hypothetical protein
MDKYNIKLNVKKKLVCSQFRHEYNDRKLNVKNQCVLIEQDKILQLTFEEFVQILLVEPQVNEPALVGSR